MAEDFSGKGLNTIIGKGSTFEGALHVLNSLRVEGVVKGSIVSTETVTVGRDGMVEAEIKAKNAIVSGKVVGNVEANERVELETNAALHGDIITKQIIISEGAFFYGNCEMKQAETEEEEQQPQANESKQAV